MITLTKCSNFPLQYCGNCLFDVCQNHLSKTNCSNSNKVKNSCRKQQNPENRT